MDLARADSNSHLFVTEPAAEYYVCGPEGFMVDMRQALEHMGVAQGPHPPRVVWHGQHIASAMGSLLVLIRALGRFCR